jgi:hypothetical protein
METVDSITSRWQYYEDFYREHQHEGMAAFIARIAPLAIAEEIYPSNRHWWLGLHKHHNHMRAVYLLCDKHGSRFGISWYKDRLPVMHTVKAMDSARWQRTVTWLDLQEKTEA